MNIDTIDNSVVFAETDTQNICPKCHRLEYMAGVRKGCGICRGVQGIAPTLTPGQPVKKEEKVNEDSDRRKQELSCDYCGKTVHGGQGKAAHEKACHKNPNRKEKGLQSPTPPAAPGTGRAESPAEKPPIIDPELREVLTEKKSMRVTVDVTGLQVFTSLQHELIDTKLRLIGSMSHGLPLMERQAMEVEVERVRQLVRQTCAG